MTTTKSTAATTYTSGTAGQLILSITFFNCEIDKNEATKTTVVLRESILCWLLSKLRNRKLETAKLKKNKIDYIKNIETAIAVTATPAPNPKPLAVDFFVGSPPAPRDSTSDGILDGTTMAYPIMEHLVASLKRVDESTAA